MVILDVLNECRELVHAETAVLNRISLEIMSESAASGAARMYLAWVSAVESRPGVPRFSFMRFVLNGANGSYLCGASIALPCMLQLLRTAWGQTRRLVTTPRKKWSQSGRRASRLARHRRMVVCLSS